MPPNRYRKVSAYSTIPVTYTKKGEMNMNRKKPLLSLLLCCMMLLSLLPVPAQAASAAFTAQPQSGTTNIGEEYAFNWANGQTPVSLKLQIANLANSEDPWEDLQTLSGTSGTVGYRPNSDPSDPDAKIYVRDGNSAYRIVALVIDKLGVVEVPSDTFVVTWTANITFDANGGTGTMESATCNVGSQYILPECTFTPPSGKMFDCWSVGGSKKTAGSKVTVPVNTTVKAQWEDIPTSITITIKDGIASWTQIPDADEYLCKVSNTMYVARVMPGETFDVDTWIKEHLDFSGSYTLTVRACKDSEVLMESEIEYEYTTTHTHLWSTDWSCDDTHHWRECIADGCGIKSIYYLGTIGRHEYSSDGICIYCGKSSAAWLDSPTITIKDGVASWTQVEGATKYKWWLKTVNGSGEVTNWIEPGDTLNLNEMLSFLDREGGTYLFSVQPFADEYTPLSAKAMVEYEYIRHYEVTFDGNGGSGGMDTVYGIRGQYTLPECTFTPPAGKIFKAWSVGGIEYAPYDTITVSLNTSVKAIWHEGEIDTVTAQSKSGNIAPVYGAAAELPELTVKLGTPAYFHANMYSWKKYSGEKFEYYQSDTFTEGTYHYEAQLRIDEAAYWLANEGLTVTVDGVPWTVGYVSSAGNASYSYAFVHSPDFVVTIPEGQPLTFHDSAEIDIGKNFVNHAITSFSVAARAEGGTAPYSFSKVSGPSWISVSSAGEISGTPIEIGSNADLVVKVTDSAAAEETITIAVADTKADPDTRTKVSIVIAESESGTITPVYNAETVRPELTVTTGEPAYFSSTMYRWLKHNGEKFVAYSGDTFTAGTYCYTAQLRIDEETHVLAEEGLTVTVDGEQWTMDEVFADNTESYSYVFVYSPVIVVTENYTVSGTVAVSGGTATASVAVVNQPGDEVILLVTQYHGDRMVAAKTCTVTAINTVVPAGTFDHQTGDTYKAFLLNKDYTPLCEATALTVN